MTKAAQKKCTLVQSPPDQMAGSQRTGSWPSPATLFDAPHGEIYRQVIREARRQKLLFALGGGFAINAYTALRRDTKDLDIYVLPSEREAMIEILTQIGLSDYYELQPYDRDWIHRGYASGAIVDVIWAMANQVAKVDKVWLSCGPEIEIEGERLRLLPLEELLWTKLYVIQRDRCDWPDVLNLLYWQGATMNWEHMLNRLGKDTALLAGVVALFTWLCPGRARTLPDWLWGDLRLIKPSLPVSAPEFDPDHVDLIDSRKWFIPELNPELAQ